MFLLTPDRYFNTIACMKDLKEPRRRKSGGNLISQKTAVVTISLLLGASAAGWLMTEFFPPDLPQRREMFRQKWGETALSWIETLRLYDPFHSFWFSGVLVLFLVVLFLCIATRWKGMLEKSFRVRLPRGPVKVGGAAPGFSVPIGEAAMWTDEKDPVVHYGKRFGRQPVLSTRQIERALEITRRVFRSRGYRFVSRADDGSAVFAASAGGWKHLGNLMFHLGILIITMGGIVGSRMGSSEILYGRRGDSFSIRDGAVSLRIDDFRILMAGRMQVSDYVTSVSLVDTSGVVVKSAEIEVNHPIEYGGTRIYQASYYLAEDEFEWAELMVYLRDDNQPVMLRLEPGTVEELPGSDLKIQAGRFLPDFRMTKRGPVSVSGSMNNPALEIILDGTGGKTAGWVFLMYPGFSTKFDRLESVVLKDIEPVYYTGLEFSRNPGAPIFMAGMVISAVGLLLLYAFDSRVARGVIDGSGIRAVGVGARWKAAFSAQLEDIGGEISRVIDREGGI